MELKAKVEEVRTLLFPLLLVLLLLVLLLMLLLVLMLVLTHSLRTRPTWLALGTGSSLQGSYLRIKPMMLVLLLMPLVLVRLLM